MTISHSDNPTSRLAGADRRRQLLDLAIELFGTRGFHATSMNDIADEAGVTKPVLYQHFSSKRALFLEALTEVGDRLIHEMRNSMSVAETPNDLVQHGMQSYFAFAQNQPAAFELLFGGDSRRDLEFAAKIDHLEQALATLVGDLIDVEGIPPEHRLMLGHGIVGLSEGTCRRWIAEEYQPPVAEIADLVAQLAWAGLRSL